MKVADGRNDCAEVREVLVIACAIPQRDLDLALLLTKREVVSAVQRGGEHGRVVFEDAGSTVALVNVEIEHSRTLKFSVAPQREDRDREIVECAESGPLRASRV